MDSKKLYIYVDIIIIIIIIIIYIVYQFEKSTILIFVTFGKCIYYYM